MEADIQTAVQIKWALLDDQVLALRGYFIISSLVEVIMQIRSVPVG